MFNVLLVWAWGSILSPIDQGVQLLPPCPHLSALKMRNQRKCTLTTGSLSLLMQWDGGPEGNQTWEQVRAAAGWAWVSQAQGLFVARAATLIQMPVTLASRLRGRGLWLGMYKSFSAVLLWPTDCSMDVEHISGSCPKMGNLGSAIWIMWIHSIFRVALQTSITCVTTTYFFWFYIYYVFSSLRLCCLTLFP